MAPRVTLLDDELNPLPGPVQVLANGDGVYTIQATDVKAGGNVYLEVTSAPDPDATPGNYALEARFGTVASSLTDFASGSLTSQAPQVGSLYIGETQLFQFLLSAGTSSTPGELVSLTIRDAAGDVVADVSATAGDVVSAPALLLTPGTYSVEVVTTGDGSDPTPFDLLGSVISDPIGPAISDPTLTPIFTSPTVPGIYTYPGGVVTTKPYWLTLLPS